MPIPPFQKTGALPPGLHRAAPDEIVARFCRGTSTRAALESPLRELISIAREVGSPGLYLNGSFVTGKEHPGDIDAIIVLPEGFDSVKPSEFTLFIKSTASTLSVFPTRMP